MARQRRANLYFGQPLEWLSSGSSEAEPRDDVQETEFQQEHQNEPPQREEESVAEDIENTVVPNSHNQSLLEFVARIREQTSRSLGIPASIIEEPNGVMMLPQGYDVQMIRRRMGGGPVAGASMVSMTMDDLGRVRDIASRITEAYHDRVEELSDKIPNERLAETVLALKLLARMSAVSAIKGMGLEHSVRFMRLSLRICKRESITKSALRAIVTEALIELERDSGITRHEIDYAIENGTL